VRSARDRLLEAWSEAERATLLYSALTFKEPHNSGFSVRVSAVSSTLTTTLNLEAELAGNTFPASFGSVPLARAKAGMSLNWSFFAAGSLDCLRWICTCPCKVRCRSIGRGNRFIQQTQIHSELSAVMAGVE
jgi:hypothetical protein